MALLGRAYPSPTMVLLAWDLPEGKQRRDFLGFSIQRSPGFAQSGSRQREQSSWLTNRLTFNGPPTDGSFVPSNRYPIQKFYWWDAQFSHADRGTTFTYTITAVGGTSNAPTPYTDVAPLIITVTLPQAVENGIGSYFNRAVVSSQAFAREFGEAPTGDKLQAALEWLANGLQDVIPPFIEDAEAVEGAIYHLTDVALGTIPAMEKFRGPFSLVYDAVPHAKDGESIPNPNLSAVASIGTANQQFEAHPRVHTSIMHDKFLVRTKDGKSEALLMGSANFTTEGLSSQANLLHTFEGYPQLAELYRARQELLAPDPTHGETTAKAGWSHEVELTPGAKARVFFPPEPGSRSKKVKNAKSVAMTTIIDAVRAATHSAVFCLFDPTDPDLLESFFGLTDEGKMMLGLINQVPGSDPSGKERPQQGAIDIYDRARKSKRLDLVGHAQFGQASPSGFQHESATIGGRGKKNGPPPGGRGKKNGPPPVFVHHKFIVIDGETDHPVIFTGSANMSNNSAFNNDENIMQITGSVRLAEIYLAEFMRLFEHYRARFSFNQRIGATDAGKRTHRGAKSETFTLTKDATWDRDWYKEGSSKSNSRIALAQSPQENGRQQLTSGGVVPAGAPAPRARSRRTTRAKPQRAKRTPRRRPAATRSRKK